RRARDSGPDSAMIPSKARLRSDRTLAKLSADVNQTFGSSVAACTCRGRSQSSGPSSVRNWQFQRAASSFDDSLLSQEFVHFGPKVLNVTRGPRLLPPGPRDSRTEWGCQIQSAGCRLDRGVSMNTSAHAAVQAWKRLG